MRATNRVWAAGCAGAVLVLIGGGYFLGVQPQLAHAAEADAAATATDGQVATSQVRLAGLSKLAARQGELDQQETVLAKSVPTGLQANTFYRRINEVAALSGVRVDAINQQAGTAYAPPAGATAAAVPAPAATPAPSASASPTAVTPVVAAAPVLAATDPRITSGNLTVVPTTVVVVGTPDAAMQFVKAIQHDERLFLVSALSTQTNADDYTKSVTTLTGSVYVLKY